MNIPLILFVLFLIAIVSCKRNTADTIYSVSYSIENGGKGAASFSLLISKDSTKYLWANYKETKTRSEVTSSDRWKKIINSIKLVDFKRINSGKRRIQYDSSDVVITINADKEYKLINREEDSVNYTKIKPLEILLKQEYKKLDSLALHL
ncbi:hypothetical protein [Flavobacterium sp. SLB02]|uniref:hypothetical protein n=1 Tax=Flavobacterium sp. SLB02 TaxID=2665645 RepID=UPI0012A99653|nr:hypothetical protein [Flavobacterium sp. SLB02]QGK73656.1 hypothetical protein GIY83_06145 [Flavobacterium sp. SLB02]